jgi:hypothetical protein
VIGFLLAVLFGAAGYAVGKGGTPKTRRVVAGAANWNWNPGGYWERAKAIQESQSAVASLLQLVNQRLPVSPGLAVAAWKEAMAKGDTVTAQQIAVVFFQPVPQMEASPTPPPIVIGEEENAALEQTYGQAEPMKAETTTTFHGQNQAPVQDVSADEWKEFLLCFKTREPSYKGERHIGAFEQSARRLSQLGIDVGSLTTEEAQLQALDKDLNNYLQSSERLLNDFTGETISVNGQKVSVTRSGILSLLKAAGPAGAKGWLTEEHQRKAFPHTTEIFNRGNGRF